MPETEKAVLSVIKTRRSVRKFKDRPVDVNQLYDILDAGHWAPSGKNNQPWRFVLLTKPSPRQDKLADCTKYKKIVLQASALIVVCLEKKAMYNEKKDHQSAGAAIQNILLAAHALGYGAVWLGEILNLEKEALEAIGLADELYELVGVIALGVPDETPGSERLPLSEFILRPSENQ